MTDGMTFKVEGVDELRRKFQMLGASQQRGAIRQTMRYAVAPVVKATKRLAPRDEHRLSKAVAVVVALTAHGAIASIGVRRRQAGQPARYAHLQEFGTAHHAAQPFMRPGLDTQKGEVLRRFAESIRRYVDRAAAKAGVK